MPYNKKLTEIIREQLSLSRNTFAQLIDVSPQTVYKWEKTATNPSWDHLDVLYKVCQQNMITHFPWYRDPQTQDCQLTAVVDHHEGEYTVLRRE